MRIAFLDRDGTLVREHADHEWPSVERLELLPGAADAVRRLKERDFVPIVVTNQYPIGEGIITQAHYEMLTRGLLEDLRGQDAEIETILHCPHPRDGDCSCIKPKPGLVMQALERHPEADLGASFVAGDSDCDMYLALHFGMRGFALPGSAHSVDHPHIRRVDSLAEVSQLTSAEVEARKGKHDPWKL